MTRARRTPMLVGVVALLAAAGCSSGAEGPTRADATTRATTQSATAPATSASPSATAPSSAASTCPPVGSARIPDGSWTGPLSITVQGSDPATQTRGKGSGQLQVVVEKGRVTGGTWALTWSSAGPSTGNGSRATLRLRGGAAGTVSGTATDPVLGGQWFVAGEATVTSPVTATARVDANGRARSPLVPKVRACRSVVGRVTPTFATGDPWAGSTVAGRWAARPTP